MGKKIGYLPEFYQGYVNGISEEEILPALVNNHQKLAAFFNNITEEGGNYRYGENKWTVKEVIVHMFDAERIFAYRALRFSRNDQTPLAGFEENDYVPMSNANNRTLRELTEEFDHIRLSTISLYSGFTEEMLNRSGEANGQRISVDALGFVIAGHANHHYTILKERYKL